MTQNGAAQSIAEAARSWPGIESHPHRFGGTEYCLGGREIGHVHGDQLVDIPFTRKIRDEIVAAGEAEPHHILPDSGWVSLYLRSRADTERALRLLKRSYDLALAQRRARDRGPTPDAAQAVSAGSKKEQSPRWMHR